MKIQAHTPPARKGGPAPGATTAARLQRLRTRLCGVAAFPAAAQAATAPLHGLRMQFAQSAPLVAKPAPMVFPPAPVDERRAK